MARLVSQPKEISPEDDQVTDWKDLNASSEEQLSEIIRETLEGISNRDIRPFMAHRMPKLFSLFDDFPPPDLIEYSDAADHHTTIIKQAQKIDTTCDKMRIYVFGNFAFATFIAVYKIFQRGKCFTLRSRVTYNFMKKDHEWFNIHEDWSPFKNSRLYNLEMLQKH
jgi:ketosteroid isomerase-like protein